MSTGGGGPPPYVGYSQQQAAQHAPPQGPPQPPQQQPQQQRAQAQAATAANPDVFVRRMYKPRLQDQPSLGAGVVGQLASLSKRGAAASTQQQPQQPEVLPSEVAQSDFLLSPALALPEEFGKIYLGETFSAYVSIVNTLPHPILLLEAQASLKSSRSSEVRLCLCSVGLDQLRSRSSFSFLSHSADPAQQHGPAARRADHRAAGGPRDRARPATGAAAGGEPGRGGGARAAGAGLALPGGASVF